MTRRVIRDYFAAFRWQKIKEAYAKGSWWMFIYFLVVIPAINGAYESKMETLAYLFIFDPVIFCMFVEPFHPAVLPKMMYLCPMSKEERREYLVKARYVRIAVPLIVGCAGVIGLLLWGVCDWISAIGVLMNISIFSVFMGMGPNVNGYGKIAENGTINGKLTLLEMFFIILAMGMGLFYSVFLNDIADVLWAKLCFIGVTVLIQIPMFIVYLRKWTDGIERVLSYERSYVTGQKK